MLQSRHEKDYSANTLLAPLIITFIVAIAAAVIAVVAITRLATFENSMDNRTAVLQFQNDRVRFCFDKQLKSCDDTSITAWNKAHPSDAFNLQAVDSFSVNP